MKKELLFLCTVVAVLSFSAYSLISTKQKDVLPMLLGQTEALALGEGIGLKGNQVSVNQLCFRWEGYNRIEYYVPSVECDRSNDESCTRSGGCHYN